MNALNPKERDALAEELGIDRFYLYQLLSGRREMEPRAAVRLERLSGHRLRRWQLRAKTWHETWPELIGTEGAPPVPAGCANCVEIRRLDSSQPEALCSGHCAQAGRVGVAGVEHAG